MLMKIQKWGNSMALRIPKAFADEMRFTVETAVEMRIEEGKLVIRPVERREYTLDDLLAGITEDNQHDEVDWGAPIGKEIW